MTEARKKRPAANLGGKIVASKNKGSESVVPHSKIPHADIDWALQQSNTILRLFIESWRCESFGKQQRLLETKLRDENLRKSMRLIEKAGLFKYHAITELRKSRWVITGWKCESLHGYYTNYWDGDKNDADHPLPTISGDEPTISGDEPTIFGDEPTYSGKREAETLSGQQFQDSQPRFNHVLTTHQSPTKVVGGVVSIPSKETERPLGVAPTMPVELEKEMQVPVCVVNPVSPNFPQPGDEIALDWPESHYHRKIGKIQTVDIESKEADILFDGMKHELTFPISRIVPASVLEPLNSAAIAQGTVAESNLATLPSPEVIALVDAIASLADKNMPCKIEAQEREEMLGFPFKKLQILHERFQVELGKRVKTSNTERFRFALRQARYLA